MGVQVGYEQKQGVFFEVRIQIARKAAAAALAAAICNSSLEASAAADNAR